MLKWFTKNKTENIQLGLVSIIVPCYNYAHFLSETLDSILAQTYVHWECLIIDDGSTDHTREVAGVYAVKDARFKYIYQKNKGLPGARNTGLKYASGEYIQFLDADDILTKEKFSLQISLLNKTPNSTNRLSLCYCDYYFGEPDNILQEHPAFQRNSPEFDHQNFGMELIKRWEIDLSIPIHCFLFESKIFKEHTIYFDVTLPNHEDWDCWMQIARLDLSISYVNQKLVAYRIHSKSMSRNETLMQQGFIKTMLKQRRAFRYGSTEYSQITKRVMRINPSSVQQPSYLTVLFYKFKNKFLDIGL